MGLSLPVCADVGVAHHQSGNIYHVLIDATCMWVPATLKLRVGLASVAVRPDHHQQRKLEENMFLAAVPVVVSWP